MEKFYVMMLDVVLPIINMLKWIDIYTFIKHYKKG